jgi:hypothetical protein
LSRPGCHIVSSLVTVLDTRTHPNGEDDVALHHAEARRLADALVFEKLADAGLLDDTQAGHLGCWRTARRWRFAALINPELPAADRGSFEAWARQRIYMVLLTDDPEADGWFKRRGDDGWQITARRVEMPVDPFVDASGNAPLPRRSRAAQQRR